MTLIWNLKLAALSILVIFIAACDRMPAPERPDSLGFVMWDSSELQERNEALGTLIGPDGSARETLAEYGNPSGAHRFRFIRRDSDGPPEMHDAIDDVVYIQSGGGTLLVGGEMVGSTRFPDDLGDLGGEIVGGERYPVSAGDLLRIPSGIPHSYLVPDGGHITYVLVRVPAFVGEVVAVPDGEAPLLDPPGLGIWKVSELEERNAVLGTQVRPDGSARETLADYGSGGHSHRFRFLRRDRSGPPELHDDIIDVVLVRSGAGTLQVGGEMIGRSNVAGSSIDGGSTYPVAAGDILHIPARTPHGYLVPDGGHITYVLVRVPAYER